MTTDEVEKKLKSIKELDRVIHELELKIRNLENGYIPSSLQLGERVRASKSNSAENRIIYILQLKDKAMKQLQAVTRERTKILDLIENLVEPDEWLVITMLFVQHYTITKVCRELTIGRGSLYQIKKRAIEYLAKVEGVN